MAVTNNELIVLAVEDIDLDEWYTVEEYFKEIKLLKLFLEDTKNRLIQVKKDLKLVNDSQIKQYSEKREVQLEASIREAKIRLADLEGKKEQVLTNGGIVEKELYQYELSATFEIDNKEVRM